MVSFDHINHFDPAQETYFEQRIAQSMADELGMKASAYKLWKSQNGTCPVCQLGRAIAVYQVTIHGLTGIKLSPVRAGL